MPPGPTGSGPDLTAPIIKVPNVRRGESIESPDATIIIPGAVGGKVHGRVVKVWRVQQATIKATESIVVGKEVIGSTDSIGTDSKVVEASPATDEITSLSAPVVTIGLPERQTSLAKELEIVTGLLTVHQVSIHNPVTIILAPDAHQRLQSIEGKPQRLKKRIKSLKVVLHEDIDDLYRRLARPGHEPLIPLMDDFFQAQMNIFDNKIKVFALLRKIVNDLGLRNSGELLQRWKERIELEKDLRQTLAELDGIREEFAKMALTLSIVEMKKEAYIRIRYGDNEQHIPGPLAQTTVHVKYALVTDPETGEKRFELLIEQQPLGA